MSQTEPWISVKDRLPEDDLPVMVYTPARDGEDERIDFEFRYEGGWYHHDDSYDHYMAVGGPNAVPGEVCTGPGPDAPYTHWMPLPAPPSSLLLDREEAGGEIADKANLGSSGDRPESLSP